MKARPSDTNDGSPDVLHINISDGGGGVGRAAHRLHTGLLRMGVRSRMWVDHKTSEDPTVWGPDSLLSRLYIRLRSRIDKWPAYLCRHSHWNYSSFNFLPNPRMHQIWKDIRPKLVHLHWFGDGMLPIQYFRHIHCPVVATLHGRWLFNGAQHLHSDQSSRFVEGFLPDNRDPMDGGWDVDRWVWQRKCDALDKVKWNIVTLSRWMERDARRSRILGGHPIVRIPNGVDTEVFHPLDSAEARNRLGLEQDKRYILFGANFAVQDRNKGFGDFVEAMRILERDSNAGVEVVVFGSNHPGGELPYKTPTHFLGFVKDEARMACVYSAADVFVLPSHQDNLPNTVMESLSCGTPCVAYDVGGVSDMIEHHANGRLVPARDSAALAGEIRAVLSLEPLDRESLREAARQTVMKEFTRELQCERMKTLYDGIKTAGS